MLAPIALWIAAGLRMLPGAASRSFAAHVVGAFAAYAISFSAYSLCLLQAPPPGRTKLGHPVDRTGHTCDNGGHRYACFFHIWVDFFHRWGGSGCVKLGIGHEKLRIRPI